MELLGEYQNGNVRTTIYDDGTKIRETEDDEFRPAFAENMDIKICNRCDGGCRFCHEGSTPDGKLGDILNEKFVDTLHPFTEIACLSGDTYVYNDSGAIRIDELHVGDKIYDSDHILRTVTQITASNKKSYLLSGDRGIRIKCSSDHPFISLGTKVNAIDSIGKQVDCLQADVDKKRQVYTLDMSKYIHEKTADLPGSVGGKLISDTEVRISNSCKSIPRYINITKQLMYLYGWFIAEGSTKGLVMNINEMKIAHKLGEIWDNIVGLPYKIYTNYCTHCLSLELYSPSIIKALFVDALKVGIHAPNKSVGFLFSINDKELIRQALMGLFDGDGCYRSRSLKGNWFYSASLKTVSRKLAYEVTFLLAKHFGVYASITHGMSPQRYIDDRVLEPSEYYMVEIYGLEDLNKVFPLKYKKVAGNTQTHKKTKFRKLEPLTGGKNQTLYDITLDEGSHVFPVNGYVLTHNCGGGNIFEHPDLVSFLKRLKEKQVIPNITVNQIHFKKNMGLLHDLVDHKLVYGVGVSLNDPSPEFINKIKEFPNAVVHTINGVLTPWQMEKLMGNDLKVLILGYKNLRRGTTYLETHKANIASNQAFLEHNLSQLLSGVKVLSFDNLAIEQLHVKEKISPEKWEEFYAGDDGTNTFYIDMVERKFARSSTAPLDKRYDLLDSVDEMFKVVRNEVLHS